MTSNNTRTRAVSLWSVVVVIALIAIAGVAVFATGGRGGDPDAAGTIDVHTVAARDFRITTTASGELEALRQVEVRSRLDVRSTIVEIVPEGTRVKAGEILVQLDNDSIKTKLEEDEARVASARAELTAAEAAVQIQISENESALRQAQLQLEIAGLSLDQWRRGDDVQRRQELDFSLERAQDEQTRLSEKYEQSVKLEKEGFISRDELKRDHLALKQADADLATAQLAKTIYVTYQFPKDREQRESDVREAEAETHRVEQLNASRLASEEADLLNRRRQLSIREENVAKLERQINDSTINAPSDGLVVYATSMQRNSWRGGNEGPWQIGSEVHPNQLIIILPDTQEMIAAVRVHESLVGRIKQGQRATVRIDAVSNLTVHGTVEDIGVLAETGGWRDPNRREYTVKVRLGADHGASMKPSMRCDAEIIMGEVDDAIAVPIQAVFSDGPVRFVYMAEGERYARRPIRLGRRSSEYAEVTDGIGVGDRVLLREPASGEVIDRPYSEEELAAAGLMRSPEGAIVRTSPSPRPGRAMGRPGGPPKG